MKINTHRAHQSILFARLCCFGVDDNILFTRLCASHDDDNFLFAGPQGPHVAQVPFLPRKNERHFRKKQNHSKKKRVGTTRFAAAWCPFVT